MRRGVLSRRRSLDRDALVARLARIDHRPAPDEERLFDQAGLGRVLPLLLDLDQEGEYRLCREVAEHLLGRVPDPGDMPF